MTTERNPSPVLPIATTFMVLVGIYVSAYFALMTPQPTTIDSRPGYVILGDLTAVYFIDDPWVSVLFGPMNWIDRRIRPNAWQPIEVPADELRRLLGP